MISLMAGLIVWAALVVAPVSLLATASWRTAMRVLLDLLTAAGLLRLAGERDWPEIAATAAIVGLRRLLSAALLNQDRPPPTGSGPTGSGSGRVGQSRRVGFW